MANIKKDIPVTPVNITKKRHKLTGMSLDNISESIIINYDVWALDASNVEIYKSGQESVVITKERFNEPDISALIQAAKTVIEANI